MGEHNKIKINKRCRLCKKIPEEGYFLSRASRHDWICPDCVTKEGKKFREKRKNKLKEDGYEECNNDM